MLNSRQPVVPRDGDPAPFGGSTLPSGFHIDAHVHAEGQLVYAASGVLATSTAGGTWIAPANRIMWTPPGVAHSHRFYGRVDARVATLAVELTQHLPSRPCAFAVTPLLRESFLALTGRPESRPGAHARLRAVISDELSVAPDQSLQFPEPRDDRLRAVIELVEAEPSTNASLTELGHAVGASERTLSRLFAQEMGMTFRQWRATVRIYRALAYLSEGLSVTTTATACGWANPTSFIEAFTRILGQTPGRYQADLLQLSDAAPR